MLRFQNYSAVQIESRKHRYNCNEKVASDTAIRTDNWQLGFSPETGLIRVTSGKSEVYMFE